MGQRTGVVTLPGLSTTSLLVNLPNVLSLSEGRPMVFIDTEDYRRLRAQAKGGANFDEKYQYLSMAYDTLRRREILYPIDYSDFYPLVTQERNLRAVDRFLEQTPNDLSRQAATKAVEGWIEYARGEYQERFRDGLGEDAAEFADLRRVEQGQRRDMRRGTGDHVSWNRKVLNKDVAALEVRRRLDRTFPGVDVKYVVAGAEHEISGAMLDAARPPGSSAPTADVLGASRGAFDAETEFLERLEPNRRIVGLDATTVSRTRELLDSVMTIATEITGTDSEDWSMLGPWLAAPAYTDLFDMEAIRRDLVEADSLTGLAEESKAVVDLLESNRQDPLSAVGQTENAQYLAETYDIAETPKPGLTESDLTSAVDYATDLADYSRELKYLVEGRHVSEAAAFLGASVAIDPTLSNDFDALYRQGHDLVARLDPPERYADRFEDHQKERRGDTWGDNTNWFEDGDRTR